MSEALQGRIEAIEARLSALETKTITINFASPIATAEECGQMVMAMTVSAIKAAHRRACDDVEAQLEHALRVRRTDMDVHNESRRLTRWELAGLVICSVRTTSAGSETEWADGRPKEST